MRVSGTLAILLSLLPMLLEAKKDEKVKIKIVEAPALNRFPSMPRLKLLIVLISRK